MLYLATDNRNIEGGDYPVRASGAAPKADDQPHHCRPRTALLVGVRHQPGRGELRSTRE
jgi:hypothetical protein